MRGHKFLIVVGLMLDIEGKLWYFIDHMSKMDVIREFEQTDA